MSWFFPSKKEAADKYHYYRRLHDDAVDTRDASKRRENSLKSTRSHNKATVTNLERELRDAKKRLENVEDIIKLMEGRGGWFASTDVPEAISKARKTANSAGDELVSSIHVSDCTAPVSPASALMVPTVEGDPDSALAMREFRSECSYLTNRISELKRTIANLKDEIDTLNRQIRACNREQEGLWRDIKEYSYKMNHYKRYM